MTLSGVHAKGARNSAREEAAPRGQFAHGRTASMRCENHPDETSVAVCVACGANICADCEQVMDDDSYCSACAEEYESEYDDDDDDLDEEEEEGATKSDEEREY